MSKITAISSSSRRLASLNRLLLILLLLLLLLLLLEPDITLRRLGSDTWYSRARIEHVGVMLHCQGSLAACSVMQTARNQHTCSQRTIVGHLHGRTDPKRLSQCSQAPRRGIAGFCRSLLPCVVKTTGSMSFWQFHGLVEVVDVW